MILIKQDGTGSSCTGSIIKERGSLLLLTASHCVVGAREVFIVDSREKGELVEDWQKRVLSKPKRMTKVQVLPNREFILSTDVISQSSNDFALEPLKKSKQGLKYLRNSKDNALTIGYDVDTRPDSLDGRIKYVGTGDTGAKNISGALLEGDFNIAPEYSPSSKTIVVDACNKKKDLLYYKTRR